MLRKLWAFCERDLRIALTFRARLLSDFIRTFSSLASFYFVAKLVAAGDYFRFVLVGVAFSSLMSVPLSSIEDTIALERGSGTLEAILLTPTPFAALVTWKALWDLVWVAFRIAAYLLLGALLFGARFSSANWAAALPAAALFAGVFLGLGMFSAGFLLLTSETLPLRWLLEAGSRFLAGVYFPVALLPRGLKALASCLPLTHALEAIRKALLQGTGLGAISKDLAILAAFAAAVLPSGLLFLRWSFDQARRKGNLGFIE